MTSTSRRKPATPAKPDTSPLYRQWVRLVSAAARQARFRLFHSEDFTYVSSIAYYAVVSLFPLLLFSVSVLGQLTDSDAEREAVTKLVLRFFPAQVDLVATQLDSLGRAGVGFSLVGMAVVIWV